MQVVPGPKLDTLLGADNRTALMKIFDPDMSLEIDTRVPIRLYGFTRGEATLAAHLVLGKSIEEAAADLGITPHTARSQLKRIFMKTDTHRQTELVVQMLPAALSMGPLRESREVHLGPVTTARYADPNLCIC